MLDAIWAALAGKDGAVQRPIRDGEKKAQVVVDLGDLTVTRKWSGARTELVVSTAGAKLTSPQKVLDELIGRLSFDPLAFATMDAAKQRAALIDLAGEDLAETLDQLAARRREAYDLRTDANREAKRIAAQLEALPVVPASTPDKEVSASDLLGRLGAVHRLEVLRSEALDVRSQIRALETRLAELTQEGKEVAAQVGTDTAASLQAEIENVDATNTAVRTRYQRVELETAVEVARNESAGYSKAIEGYDGAREQMLAAASFPVEGLSFDDEGVLYNGVPFAQASAAERLRVSVAMAMAMNPKVRVIRITDGSLLDSDNLALIESMAAEKDFQVWIERVDESGEVGVVIEDGEVRA